MIDFAVLKVIFDADDTLLDNKPGNPGYGRHEQDLAAARRSWRTTRHIDLRLGV